MTIPAPEMTDLLACPFCGGKCIAWRYLDMGFRRVRISCEQCIVQGPATHEANEAEIVAAWNTRAHPIGDTLADGLDDGPVVRILAADLDQLQTNVGAWREECDKLAVRLAASERERDEARENAAYWVKHHDKQAALVTEYAQRALASEASERERDEAVRNADKVCDSYAVENQRLFDRAAAAEAKVPALTWKIEQIKVVCEDNAPASCRHDLALKFIEQVARAALEQAKP